MVLFPLIPFKIFLFITMQRLFSHWSLIFLGSLWSAPTDTQGIATLVDQSLFPGSGGALEMVSFILSWLFLSQASIKQTLQSVPWKFVNLGQLFPSCYLPGVDSSSLNFTLEEERGTSLQPTQGSVLWRHTQSLFESGFPGSFHQSTSWCCLGSKGIPQRPG